MDNENMTDIPLWVPAITAVAPIVAVTIPLVINAIRDDRRDMRVYEGRLAQERQRDTRRLREECATLLGTAHDFQVLVENDYEYSGPEKNERGWEIRQRAGDIAKQVDQIGILVPGLVAAADALGAAAALLVPTLADDKGRQHGGSTKRPDLTDFEQSLKEFKATAINELAALATYAPLAAAPACERPRGAAGTKAGRWHRRRA
jgi:hypothetical protein